jgi:hypothetical protein
MRDGHPAAKLATGRQLGGVSRPHRQDFTSGGMMLTEAQAACKNLLSDTYGG